MGRVGSGRVGTSQQAPQSGVRWWQLLVVVVLWQGFIFAFHAKWGSQAQSAPDFAQGIHVSQPLGEAPNKRRESLLKRMRSMGVGAPDTSGGGGGDLGAAGAQLSARAEWQSSGGPAQALASLQSKLYYWKLDPLANSGLMRQPSAAGDKYVLFLTDCGGFNNIRMAFEYFVIMAWVTRRTLVLPPPAGWYLIDFGPFARMAPDASEARATDYREFFDMEHIAAAVPVISTEEFRRREGARLGLPRAAMEADFEEHGGREAWKHWLKSEADPAWRKSLPWSPLAKVLFFPSIAAVEAQFPEGVPKEFTHHREVVELTPELYSAPALSFPSCKDNEAFRYLVQVNSIAAFADEALSRSYKRMLRDNVHYRALVFDVAARVIQFLGPFNYAAFHIRRNDLQYKEVFMSASATLENVRPLLKGGERVYVATDESNFDTFFKPMEDEFEVFHWDDFFTEKGGNVLTGIDIPRKLEGCIEQVICALGRIFFGTLESTFTSYIFRLRGYYHAPDTEVYFHTLKYSDDVKANRARTWSRKPLKGQIYKSENPSIWEDAESPHTTW